MWIILGFLAWVVVVNIGLYLWQRRAKKKRALEMKGRAMMHSYNEEMLREKLTEEAILHGWYPPRTLYCRTCSREISEGYQCAPDLGVVGSCPENGKPLDQRDYFELGRKLAAPVCVACREGYHDDARHTPNAACECLCHK